MYKLQSILTVVFAIVFQLANGQFARFVNNENTGSASGHVRKKSARRPLDSPNGGITNISFVGNGDIQKSISQNSDIQANTGLGIIFFRSWSSVDEQGRKRVFQNIQFDFVVNVASTSDTVKAAYENGLITNRRDFGNYILNPVNSKQATFLDFYAYTNNENNWGRNGSLNWLRNILSGFNGRFVASNSVWKDQTSAVNLSGFLIRAGFFHDFIPDAIRIDKDYSVTAGVSYSYRGILGDVRFKENEPFRKNLLSTERVRYHGLEFNIGLRLNNIRAEVQVPMFKYGNAEVIGLTNTQFVTSIRFVGGFPLKIRGGRGDDTEDEGN